MFSTQAPTPSATQGSTGGNGNRISTEDPADTIFIDGLPYYFKEENAKEVLELFGPLGSFGFVNKGGEAGNNNTKAACFVYQDVTVSDVACAALNGLKMGAATLIVRRAYHTEQQSHRRSSSHKVCGICLCDLTPGKGQAIFTAECSHSFHYPCIANNIQHGNLSCPNCRTKWDKNNVPFQVPPLKQNCRPPVPQVTVPQLVQVTVPQLVQVTVPQLVRFHPYRSYRPPSWNYPPRNTLDQEPQDPPEPSTFSDDEPLHLSTTSPMQCTAHQNVTIKAYTECSAISALESNLRFPVLVSIRAPSLEDFEEHARTPIDLVTVLDISGSMIGTKLSLLKRAMKFVIDNLSAYDRLSIVTFSTKAKRVLPLQRMSAEGRESAILAVESLVASGGTNIAEGLKKGTKVLEDRREKNPVASIVLLSDGHDNYYRTPSRMLKHLPASIRSSDMMQHEMPVYTFGFGQDHDAKIMHAISDASGGTFSFIESVGMIQDAFALCLGGLLSVVAQEFSLAIKVASPGVKIVEIPSGRHVNKIFNEGQQGRVDIGDMYAEEEKQFLVYLHVMPSSPNTKTSLLDVSCEYKDLASNKSMQVQGKTVEISRPQICSPAEKAVSLEVDRQRNRIVVAETIAEAQKLAEAGNLEAARALLAERRAIVLASAAAQAGDGHSNLFETELREVMERMASMDLYSNQGRAYALAEMSSHSLQRASARGDTRTSCLARLTQAESDQRRTRRLTSFKSRTAGLAASASGGGSFGSANCSSGAAPDETQWGSAAVGAFETPAMIRMVQKSQQSDEAEHLV